MTEPHKCQKKSVDFATEKKIKLVAVNARYSHSCLALFYLRGELERNIPEAIPEILQLTINDNYHQMLLRIMAEEPFAIFLSAAIWNSEIIGHLIKDIHRCMSHCRIVVGGPQAGVLRAQLPESACTMVIGEIEAVGLDFYHDLANGDLKPRYVASFFSMHQPRFSAPYRDDDFTSDLAHRHIYFETSRGCPHACTYCLSAAERGLYHKNLGQVKDELKEILKHKPKVIRFVDRTFNDLPRRALDIWRFLLDEDADTNYHFEIAPENFTDEMYQLLQQVACGQFQFEIGIQSTNQETLHAIQRKVDPSQVHEVIARLADLATIHLHLDLILGLPYETYKSFARSFAEVFAMGPHYIQMGLLKILPDTPISKYVDEYGYHYSARPPYSVLANRWLDRAEMSDLYWFSEGVEKFYNNRYFTSIWSYLRARDEDIFSFFKKLQEIGKSFGLFERAPTQNLLTEMLCFLSQQREDKDILLDLLCYDWLRCGHRVLPDFLHEARESENPEQTRDILHHRLPAELKAVFSRHGRNRFFKRAVFLFLAAPSCEILGLGTKGKGARVALLADREKSLFGHNSIFVLEEL